MEGCQRRRIWSVRGGRKCPKDREGSGGTRKPKSQWAYGAKKFPKMRVLSTRGGPSTRGLTLENGVLVSSWVAEGSIGLKETGVKKVKTIWGPSWRGRPEDHRWEVKGKATETKEK